MNAIAMPPSIDRRRAFLAMLDDFEALDPHNSAFYAPARQDFARYVNSLLDSEAGRELAAGHVPCTHRWLAEPGGDIVGVTRLRHHIDTPALAESIGHIGYDVAPSKRRRGHGHFALEVALGEARRFALRARCSTPAKATPHRGRRSSAPVACWKAWPGRRSGRSASANTGSRSGHAPVDDPRRRPHALTTRRVRCCRSLKGESPWPLS